MSGALKERENGVLGAGGCRGGSPGGESVEAGGVLLSGCQQPLDTQNLGIVSHLSVVLVELPG